VVAAALLGALAYGVWYGLDAALGRSLAAQAAAVLGGIAAGLVIYAAAVWVLRVPEAREIRRLLMSRSG
jgi:putative peptidoglycan lipid II flippase